MDGAQRLPSAVPGDDDVVADRAARPVGRQDQHRRAGFDERPVERAVPHHVARRAARGGGDHQIDAMGEGVSFAGLLGRHEHGLDPCVAGGGIEHLLRGVRTFTSGQRFRRADVDPDEPRAVRLGEADGEMEPFDRFGGRVEVDENILVGHDALHFGARAL